MGQPTLACHLPALTNARVHWPGLTPMKHPLLIAAKESEVMAGPADARATTASSLQESVP
jgi:hypothetical protein